MCGDRIRIRNPNSLIRFVNNLHEKYTALEQTLADRTDERGGVHIVFILLLPFVVGLHFWLDHSVYSCIRPISDRLKSRTWHTRTYYELFNTWFHPMGKEANEKRFFSGGGRQIVHSIYYKLLNGHRGVLIAFCLPIN